jgi:hypothetical protein
MSCQAQTVPIPRDCVPCGAAMHGCHACVAITIAAKPGHMQARRNVSLGARQAGIAGKLGLPTRRPLRLHLVPASPRSALRARQWSCACHQPPMPACIRAACLGCGGCGRACMLGRSRACMLWQHCTVAAPAPHLQRCASPLLLQLATGVERSCARAFQRGRASEPIQQHALLQECRMHGLDRHTAAVARQAENDHAAHNTVAPLPVRSPCNSCVSALVEVPTLVGASMHAERAACCSSASACSCGQKG